MNKKIITLVTVLFLTATCACGNRNTTSSVEAETSTLTEASVEASEPEISVETETSVEAKESETGDTDTVDVLYTYIHNPLVHIEAMKDVIVDENAIYGFSPNPESSRLGTYAEYDWSDAAVVAAGREDRIAYHKSIESMYEMLDEMMAEGKDIETIARAISAERNRIRLESYADDPDGLAKLKESNLNEYGNEEGPTPDQLYEKYGSWEKVLEKAFSVNMGMDICLGLYDDYYDQYLQLGLFPNIIDSVMENNPPETFTAGLDTIVSALSALGIDADLTLAYDYLGNLDGYKLVSETIEDGLIVAVVEYDENDMIEKCLSLIHLDAAEVSSVQMILKVNPDTYELVSGNSVLITPYGEKPLFTIK